jgi:hypothetical protein
VFIQGARLRVNQVRAVREYQFRPCLDFQALQFTQTLSHRRWCGGAYFGFEAPKFRRWHTISKSLIFHCKQMLKNLRESVHFRCIDMYTYLYSKPQKEPFTHVHIATFE